MKILKISAFAVFLGRGWQHMQWNPPLGELLESEYLLRKIIESLSIDWHSYISIELPFIIATAMGIVYLLCAFIVILPTKIIFTRTENNITNMVRNIALSILFLGITQLFFLSMCYWKAQFFRVGQLLEYSLQVFVPIAYLFLFSSSRPFSQKINWVQRGLLIGTSFTFFGHGLYAIGYYPTPNDFVYFSTQLISLDESQSLLFLKIVGALDIVTATFLIIPIKKVRTYILLYAVFWGTCTTLARPLGWFDPSFPLPTLMQGICEMIFRIPHALIPLVLYLFYLKDTSKNPLKRGF